MKPSEYPPVTEREAIRNLAAAIVLQAVMDYVKPNARTYKYEQESAYTFLNSDTCDAYLTHLDINMTGKDIIKRADSGQITREQLKRLGGK